MESSIEEHTKRIEAESKLESLQRRFDVIKKDADDFFRFVNNEAPYLVDRYYQESEEK